MNSNARVYFYVREAAAWNVELLCRDCHGRITVAQNRARRLARFYSGNRGVPTPAAAA